MNRHRVNLTAAVLALCCGQATANEPAVDFENHVIPLLTKHGCNAGACHGAAIGRGGFKLSLYGGDPPSDYQAIVRQRAGRRVNVTSPANSLLLLKPTEHLLHGGGEVFPDDSASGQRLLQWIQEGAPFRAAGRQAIVHVDVQPRQWVGAAESPVPLRVIARYEDQSTRDVTRWTLFHPEDETATSIDLENFTARVHRPGRHLIVARFLNTVAPVELIVPMSSKPSEPAPGTSVIDQHVNTMLSKLQLPMSPPADDASFIRRATLDLNGRLPTPEQVQRYVEDSRHDKRSQLIDRLIADDAFIDYWTLRFAKLLRLRPKGDDGNSLRAYHHWLKQQLRSRASYKDMARQLILASGDSWTLGPANFYRTAAGPREQAEFFSELFMGSRLRCANCHNHPLDQWTQDDYHGLAAVFARLETGRTIRQKPTGTVIHPRTREVAVPRIPGGQYLDDPELPADLRGPLAEWLTSDENPYFAPAMVNRIWQALMGRGLVDPVDDFRHTNPATHPQLLAALSDDFRSHNYQITHVIKKIAMSDAYARSAITLPNNRNDRSYYSHYLRRPLPPEVLADAISDVLQLPQNYGNQEDGRAVTLMDPTAPSTSLDILGRCNREDSCDNELAAAAGMPKQLHLLNGPLINERLHAREGRLHELLEKDTPPMDVISQFYLAALSRPMTAAEREHWQRQVSELAPPQHREFLEDVVWGLLCCRDFVENH